MSIKQNCKGNIIGKKNGFEIIDCIYCGFAHMNPIPNEEALNTIYSDEYYVKNKPTYIDKMEEDLDWWNIVYDERFEVLEEYLGSKGSIADIGSGTGHFLNRGSIRGWKTLGFEPSKEAYQYSSNHLGLDVINEFFDEKNCHKISDYDAVHMSSVLEHLPDPIGSMRLVYENLNTDSLICVTVPNDYNPFQLILRNDLKFPSWWESPPHHINYFNFKSLEKLFLSVGFKVFYQTASFPIDLFLLMGKNYVNTDIVGRECHNLRKQFEISLSMSGNNNIKKDLYQKFSEIGLGREIIMYGVKE